MIDRLHPAYRQKLQTGHWLVVDRALMIQLLLGIPYRWTLLTRLPEAHEVWEIYFLAADQERANRILADFIAWAHPSITPVVTGWCPKTAEGPELVIGFMVEDLSLERWEKGTTP